MGWEGEVKFIETLTITSLVCRHIVMQSCKPNVQFVIADMIKSVNNKFCDWLMNASMHQAPNPYTKNPFKKDQAAMVNEIDGTQSRNFFTVLNVGM